MSQPTFDGSKGWYGIDLDGTLAYDDGWKGEEHIGEPIPAMLTRVERFLAEGKDVRIFTARVATDDNLSINQNYTRVSAARRAITRWCETYLGQALPITCRKDMQMIALYDDRAVQIVTNTGQRVDGCSE